jgi:simple sugar transport system permease protein
MYHLLWRTRVGYEIRVIGLSPSAAHYAGINIGGRLIITMSVAGAFAGLVGSNFVLGYKHYFEMGFGDGIGFIGIAVALVGRNHPLGIALAALFFGVLEYGGLTINTMVPKELVNILQAIVILFVIILSKLFSRWSMQFQQA